MGFEIALVAFALIALVFFLVRAWSYLSSRFRRDD